MTEERGISMTEFKAVVESFQAEQKKIVEVMNHRFDKLDGRMDGMDSRMGRMENRMDRMEGHVVVIKEQLGLVMESQTEMKVDMKNKVDREEFSRLEKRVARLERKTV